MTLLERIHSIIDKEGGISVSEYMQLALSDPDEGYYMSQTPLGAGGDFVTAPEISQVFGEMLGIWIAECWHMLGKPKADLVEFGPGHGTLMDDFLRATRSVKGFHDAIDVHMVETSAKLRKHQRYLLNNKHPRIQWHETLPKSERVLFVIGNEFFDALPIAQYVVKNNNYHERIICRQPAPKKNEEKVKDDAKKEASPMQETKEPDALMFDVADERLPRLPTRYLQIDPATLQEGDVVEICPMALEVMQQIAKRIARAGGAGLFIDYGYLRAADAKPVTGDTFQAVRKHRYHHVLHAPGSADLTAHVDFTTLAQAAVAEGAYTPPVLTQGEFMLRMGGELRMKQLCEKAHTEAVCENIANGFRRLIDPKEMGELFKVLAVMSAGIPAPIFTNQPKEEK